MGDITIRNANLNDIPFLIKTIIEAEKSGTEKLTYSTIFGLNQNEIETLLQEILNEEVDNCELSVSGFLIAEKNGDIAGALSGWLENESEIPSSILKGNLLNYYLTEKSIEKASTLSYLTKSLHVDYIPKTFQIGAGYVAENFRGQQILGNLTSELISFLQKKHPEVKEIYAQIFDCNTPSLRTYEKAGFKVIANKVSEISEITQYLPSSKKIILKKELF